MRSRLASADGVEDMEFVGVQLCGEAFEMFHIVGAGEDVYVLADLALLVQHAVAKGWALSPKRIQRIARGAMIAIKGKLC